jgi:hypothetical protein
MPNLFAFIRYETNLGQVPFAERSFFEIALVCGNVSVTVGCVGDVVRSRLKFLWAAATFLDFSTAVVVPVEQH